MNRLFVLCLFILFALSCKKEDKVYKANSYDLIFYKKSNGKNPKVGEHVFFQMAILDDNKNLLKSYRNQKQMPTLKIPPLESRGRTKNPIPEALIQMAVNDSAAIIIPRDSIDDLAIEYDGVKYLEYVLVLKEILTESEYQQRRNEIKDAEYVAIAATKARLPEVELLVQKTLKDFKAGNISLKYTENGVAYFIHERGKGDMPTKDRLISTQYYGLLQSNGHSFDNSFEKGRSYSFRLGRGAVIKGWDEAFMEFPIGTKASVFIPSQLAYGKNGLPPDIPPDADLYFYVELEEMYY